MRFDWLIPLGLIAALAPACSPEKPAKDHAASPATPSQPAAAVPEQQGARTTGATGDPMAAHDLKLPDGIPQEFYDQVRADQILGPALDRDMIPALQASGSPGERITAFGAAREKAVAQWKASLTPEQAASVAAAPMANPTMAAFHRVSTDVLRAYIVATAERFAASSISVSDKITALNELEAHARTSFTWDTPSGASAEIRVQLIRNSLEQKKPAMP